MTYATDPDARLFKKGGQATQLCYLGHVLTDNRHGLAVDAELMLATGPQSGRQRWRCSTAGAGGRGGGGRSTLGTDRCYDTRDFVTGLRECGVTPHVAQNNRNRRSAIDGRTTRHSGYVVSQRRRKRVEEVFGWGKTVGGRASCATSVGRGTNSASSSPPPPTTWCG
ncbi:MAG: hypothetical protein CVU47_00470 [Chloroflexi bacterium HGW-Chloroflexi-9]|nr:MAG: hypothetical protein CVU47_00470 [Chloroflexi bacterium HGW-Chloroflexi-9]